MASANLFPAWILARQRAKTAILLMLPLLATGVVSAVLAERHDLIVAMAALAPDVQDLAPLKISNRLLGNQVRSLEVNCRKVRWRQASLYRVVYSQNTFERMLVTMATALPADVVLTRIAHHAGELTVEGHFGSPRSLVDFRQGLLKNPAIRNVQLSEMGRTAPTEHGIGHADRFSMRLEYARLSERLP